MHYFICDFANICHIVVLIWYCGTNFVKTDLNYLTQCKVRFLCVPTCLLRSCCWRSPRLRGRCSAAGGSCWCPAAAAGSSSCWRSGWPGWTPCSPPSARAPFAFLCWASATAGFAPTPAPGRRFPARCLIHPAAPENKSEEVHSRLMISRQKWHSAQQVGTLNY